MAIRLIRSMYFAIISKQRNGKEDFNMSKYLVVVDMQKDFIDGSLGTKEAQAIVPKVREGRRIQRTCDVHTRYARRELS